MKFEWNRPLGIPGDPYLRRWVLPLPGGWSIRLHHWLSDDDPEAWHDHPTWFWTWILRGGYLDSTQDPWDPTAEHSETLKRGDLRFRAADHMHAVLYVRSNTWTLCLFGRETRRWKFLIEGRELRRDKFFAEVGHHTPQGGRVRLRPDGTTI